MKRAHYSRGVVVTIGVVAITFVVVVFVVVVIFGVVVVVVVVGDGDVSGVVAAMHVFVTVVDVALVRCIMHGFGLKIRFFITYTL